MFLENPHKELNKKGWIEVVVGSMFSGKTEELIRRMKRAKIARQKVEIFKPQIDVRYSEEEVVACTYCHEQPETRDKKSRKNNQLGHWTARRKIVWKAANTISNLEKKGQRPRRAVQTSRDTEELDKE